MDNNLVDNMNKTEEPKEEKGFWDKITDRFKGGVNRLEKQESKISLEIQARVLKILQIA